MTFLFFHGILRETTKTSRDKNLIIVPRYSHSRDIPEGEGILKVQESMKPNWSFWRVGNPENQ